MLDKKFWLIVLVYCWIIPEVILSAEVEESIRGITIKAWVDKSEVPLNRNVILTIQISWIGKHDEYKIEEFQPPVCKNLKIVGSSCSDKVESRKDKQIAIREYQFILQPETLGMGYIESVEIVGKQIATDRFFPLRTSRIGVKVIEPIVEKKNNLWIIWLILVLVLVLVCSICSFLWWRKQQSIHQEPEEMVKTPEEIAREELNAITELRNIEHAVQYCTEVSTILRKYINIKFGIKALEVPTNELVDQLKAHQEIPEMITAKLQDIFKVCDMVKFAKYIPALDEIDTIHKQVEEIISVFSDSNALSDE